MDNGPAMGSFTTAWATENLAPHALLRLAECPATADLEQAAGLIEQLRISLLFDREGHGMSAMSEQHALCAIALLDQAEHHMRMAAYEQASAVATFGGQR